MQGTHTVLLVRLLQASSGVCAATPYGVVTLVELPVDNVRFTPGGPVICRESLYAHALQSKLCSNLLKLPQNST